MDTVWIFHQCILERRNNGSHLLDLEIHFQLSPKTFTIPRGCYFSGTTSFNESIQLTLFQDQGVKVFVMLYKEVEVALGNKSSFKKNFKIKYRNLL